MTIRFAALLFLLTITALLQACATGDKSNSSSADDPGISKIPWNRPESWEGQGPLGGMMQNQMSH